MTASNVRKALLEAKPALMTASLPIDEFRAFSPTQPHVVRWGVIAWSVYDQQIVILRDLSVLLQAAGGEAVLTDDAIDALPAQERQALIQALAHACSRAMKKLGEKIDRIAVNREMILRLAA